MKKFLIVLLSVICLACLSAVACTDKSWYSLTFLTDDGVTVECEVQSGAEVQAGYEIKFTLVLDENVSGEPEVTVNGKALSADAQGVYSFKMAEDTVVEITGVSLLGTYSVEFRTELEAEDGEMRYFYNDWVQFKTPEGELLRDVEVTSGDVIKFQVNVSVYYGGADYTVSAGSAILTPDAQGYYTYTVTGKQTVLVKGLPSNTQLAQNSFAGRPALDSNGKPMVDSNGDELPEGIGTQDRPYLIKTPFDLYYLSEIVKDTNWQTAYITQYYRLENDIDLKGEKLNVIGDNTSQASFFAGTFDGNGHTIKNYYMTDTLSNLESDYETHLNCVGLFGFTTITQNGSAGIYNLNLEDFEIRANGLAHNEEVYAGAFVGYGIGTNISNCTASGTIIVDGDSNRFSYVGGIIGLQQSAFSGENTRFYSVVQSCSSNVNIRSESGYTFAAGGITGYLLTYEERTTASILNCYSEGNVIGVMRAGGIAGCINAYSSVKNCYATGNISANSTLNPSASEQGEYFAYAYAGGITGYAEYGSIISDCFFTGRSGARATAGNNYSAYGDFVGGKDETGKTALIHVEGALVLNCHSSSTATINDSFIKNTLGWSDKDWTFGNGLPKINQSEESKTFTVTVKIGNDTAATLSVTDNYIPVSYWYYLADVTEGNNKLPEFLGTGSARTYGYYFDPELTQQVPFGYVFTDNITIYAAYANYNNVVGDYYIENGGGKHFTLTDDGYIFYYDRAVNSVSTYVYNGEYLILNNTFFAIMSEKSEEFYSFKAEVKDGIMSIYDNTLFPAGNPLKALKKLDGFNYGTYYDADNVNVQYTFNADGTGLSGSSPFTYTVSGNSITASGNLSGTIKNGNVVSFGGKTLTAFDDFMGVWEKSYASDRRYEFDGKGNWKYNGFDTNQTLSGKYEMRGANTIILDNGKTATYADGVVTIGGVKYYNANSFVGTWILNLRAPIEITFGGIGVDGSGKVHLNYGTDYEALDLTYQADRGADGKVYISIYNYYEAYGSLTFDSQTKTLTGSIYRADKKSVVNGVSFCLYDDYKGTWTGTDEEGKKLDLSFNGLGSYNITGGGELIATYGSVTVNGDKTDRVRYTLEFGALKGSVTINKKTYNLEYDEEADVIILSIDGGESFTMARS